VLDAIAGYDPKDPVTAASYRRIPESYTAFLQPNGLRGMRFGVIRQPMDKQTDTNAADYKEIRAMIDRVVGVLKTRGAEIVDPIEIPNLLGLLQDSGAAPNTNIYETEQAINGYLTQHPDTPIRTFRAIVESPLLIEARRRALIYAVGHVPTEPGFPLQRLTQEALRTEVLKTMADNRLDAFLYATYDHAPTKLPHTTLGNNRQLAPVLGFPALAVPGGVPATACRSDLNFSACHSPKGLCSKRRMTSNSPQKFAGLRPLHRHCQNETLVGHICGCVRDSAACC
jgi:amidase